MNGSIYFAPAVLGSIFGSSELMTRYRDKPGAALTTAPGLFYIGIVNVMGDQVLTAAVKSLGYQIARPKAEATAATSGTTAR